MKTIKELDVLKLIDETLKSIDKEIKELERLATICNERADFKELAKQNKLIAQMIWAYNQVEELKSKIEGD